MNHFLHVGEKSWNFTKKIFFGPLPNFRIFKNSEFFLHFWNQCDKRFWMIYILLDFYVHVRKNPILKYRKFQTPENFRNFENFSKMFHIRDQWAELFHLIYSFWGFLDKSGQPWTPYDNLYSIAHNFQTRHVNVKILRYPPYFDARAFIINYLLVHNCNRGGCSHSIKIG